MVKEFPAYLSNSTYINTIYVDGAVKNESCSLFYMDLDDVREGEVTCVPKDNCNLLCFEDIFDGTLNRSRREVSNNSSDNGIFIEDKDLKMTVGTVEETSVGSFYMTGPFWAFVVLMCIGTVAFNVANCIGDAVCFDVLGKYEI